MAIGQQQATTPSPDGHDGWRSPHTSAAWIGGHLATGLKQISKDPAVLDTSGRWAVAITFEGEFWAARFDSWQPLEASNLPDTWAGPDPHAWRSNMSEGEYCSAVSQIRGYIAAGDVYQVNLCRVLTAPLSSGQAYDPLALSRVLQLGNPAPYAGALRLPEVDVRIASASPELFLSRHRDEITSRPIKGTAPEAGGFLAKDTAENVMIVDLVRNDLGRVAKLGSVTVPDFLVTENHPGLSHLVSTVHAEVRAGVGWPQILAAAFPPGSVTGAPKLAALKIIRELEPDTREAYCGAFGWVDADTQEAELCVAIRTFWMESGESDGTVLRFGTGAGITWGSDAQQEWQETQLKASRLVTLASSC